MRRPVFTALFGSKLPWSREGRASGQLADGTNISHPFGGGISQNNYYMNPQGVFGNNSVHDNVSGFRKVGYNGEWQRNDYDFTAFGDNPPAISFGNASWAPGTAAAPTPTDEANELLLWNEKLLANGIIVGSPLFVPVVAGSIQLVSGNSQAGSGDTTLPASLVARAVGPTGAPSTGVNVGFMVATANARAIQQFGISDANGLVSSQIVLGAAPAGVLVNVIAAGYTGATFRLSITQSPTVIRRGPALNEQVRFCRTESR